MRENTLQKPGAVSAKTTPTGDNEREGPEKLSLSLGSCLIWTKRMLENLVRGNEGKKWHTLIDKVFSLKNLNPNTAIQQSRDVPMLCSVRDSSPKRLH